MYRRDGVEGGRVAVERSYREQMWMVLRQRYAKIVLGGRGERAIARHCRLVLCCTSGASQPVLR